MSVAVIEKAIKLRAEHEQRMAEYLARQVANQLLPGVARIMRAHAKGLVRALTPKQSRR
ncbi:MAG: hypothetical protein H6515_14620 [Microthrixaceae bacterium]|nr:hypothetical protein [Microthrixaceae bacterium]